MMIASDFLSAPIKLKDDVVNVLCIENRILFRNVITALYNETPEEIKIVFSENFKPFNFKGKGCFITDYYNLNVSSSVIKKLYEEIAVFCNNDLQTETLEIKTKLINYFELIVKNFDYDFNFNMDVNLSDLFKMQNLKPNISNEHWLESLLDFILLIKKYTSTKIFVLLNLHSYFTKEEIDVFCKEIVCNHISLLLLEDGYNFSKSDLESVRIIDSDLCEIIEN